ncbi:VOC family protein [Allosalinactinospora lopnorensis]|uniref:VOC family protein n=1 Tax=Allosalinactinospora lopnorensis TaxID=1352348 RepID=UPI000623E851|nr:VOC family protein [Allosalinactinospora lopnorensis]
MTSPVLNRGLDHIALRVYDMDATVEFYTRALGFRFVREWSVPEAGVHRAVFLDADDDRVVELFDAASTPPGGSARALDAERRPSDEDRGRAATLVHFAVRTDDCAALFERAVAAGARPLGEPRRIETAGEDPMTFQAAFVYGPNDEVIEFIDRVGRQRAE